MCQRKCITYQGSCLCRGVQFSVNGFSEKAANCYCSMCRKFHGAAFGTLVGVQGLNWLLSLIPFCRRL
ncbi:GFA family protein [Photobacterium sp. Hal280]|uniref:GFA family protein n=1 Tax=Photobacterium sp. Hal280 TaxID=3035163 RepID=UPI003FA7C1B1